MEIAKNLPIKLPKRPLTNIDLKKFAKLLKIQYFRGVFMRNSLPRLGPHSIECGIVNLDNKEGEGTHWVAYWKIYNYVMYFDSFGDLQPPIEIIKYLNKSTSCQVMYNYKAFQTYNSVNCGHLCLQFLYKYNVKVE